MLYMRALFQLYCTLSLYSFDKITKSNAKGHHVSLLILRLVSGLGGALINLECKMHGHGFGFPLKSSFTRIGMASIYLIDPLLNILGNILLRVSLCMYVCIIRIRIVCMCMSVQWLF